MGKRINAYAIHSVVCEEIGIGERSPVDVAIVKSSHRIQKPENILLIVELRCQFRITWEYAKSFLYRI